MARTIEFGDDEHRILAEDGTSTPGALAVPELAEVEVPKVSKTQARAAANLRYSGASYEEIARILEYKDAAAARRVVEDALARAYPDESRESLHRLANARLEQLMFKLAERTNAYVPQRDEQGRQLKDAAGNPIMEANPEQLAYVKVVADLNTRWSRLHGLDAPQQIQVSPNAEAFDKVISAARGAIAAGREPEADIFDLEDVEDAEEVEAPEAGELDG